MLGSGVRDQEVCVMTIHVIHNLSLLNLLVVDCKGGVLLEYEDKSDEFHSKLHVLL